MDHIFNLHNSSLLLFFLLFSAPCFEGQTQVVGPPQPIVVTVGDDIILPCHLQPAVDASDITVEWARLDLNPRFIYVWRDSVELESKKHPSYKGRTSLFTDKLKLGDISMALSKVKVSDEGRYRCFIPALGDCYIELVVVAVSLPVIVSIGRTSNKAVIHCESKGWYPEPEVLWLDGEGNLLSAGPPETVRGPDDLYTVSSRVTVEKRHSNSFTCRVQQKNINQTRETQISISADFLTVSPSSSTCTNIVIALVTLFLCSLAVAFTWWKCKQKKSRQILQLSSSQVSDGTRMQRHSGGPEQLVTKKWQRSMKKSHQ